MAAKIIKGGGGPQSEHHHVAPPKLIEREVVLAHDEARRILEQAQARARQIVEEAKHEAEAIRTTAEQRGAQTGLAHWEERIASLAGERDRMLLEAKPQLVMLSLRVAEKILRRQLELEPDAIVPLVEETLRAARGFRAGQLVVRVHPDDVSALEAYRTQLVERDARWNTLDVVGDEGLARGGCQVETDFGTIDASVETQLKAIEHVLSGAR